MQASHMVHPRLLLTDFQVINGRLEIDIATDGDPIGDPVEAWERIFLVRGDKQEVIYNLTDLAGKVRIQTPEGALSFVRLFTSPATFYLAQSLTQPRRTRGTGGDYPGGLEVIARERLNPGYFFGDRESFKFYRELAEHDGMAGIVHEAVLRRLGIKPAAREKSGGLFHVHRVILQGSPGLRRSAMHVFEREETVTTDGRVTLHEKDITTPAIRSVHWYFPVFA